MWGLRRWKHRYNIKWNDFAIDGLTERSARWNYWSSTTFVTYCSEALFSRRS